METQGSKMFSSWAWRGGYLILPYMIIAQHTAVSEALFLSIANRWALVLSINEGWGMKASPESHILQRTLRKVLCRERMRHVTVKLY